MVDVVNMVAFTYQGERVLVGVIERDRKHPNYAFPSYWVNIHKGEKYSRVHSQKIEALIDKGVITDIEY